MKITILTICPEEFDSFRKTHVISRAVSLGLLSLDIVDIRDFAGGSFRRVDDSPFGGGRGLLLRCVPVLKAVEWAKKQGGDGYTAALCPAGNVFNQKKAHEWAQKEHLILICGHYEGLDARIYNHVDERVSIGDFVISGGELASMVITDAVARLLKGNLKAGSAEDESFENGLLEYPQYTQPADYNGEKVPEVLLSGNHARIDSWRHEQALSETKKYRPELLQKQTISKTTENA